MSKLEIDLKEYIKTGFDRLEAKLDAISATTNQNNQAIAILQNKYEQSDKDLTSLGNNNRLQHSEFYTLIKDIRSELDRASITEMKEDVKRHDSELDKLSGALKIGGWIIGFIFSIIGVLLAFK